MFKKLVKGGRINYQKFFLLCLYYGLIIISFGTEKESIIEKEKKDICLITDDSLSPFSISLLTLYPNRINVITLSNLTKKNLEGIFYVVTQITKRENVSKLNFTLIERFAAEGGQVIMCLDEYAYMRKLRVKVVRVQHIKKRTLLEESFQSVPCIEIVEENDVTYGFPKGSIVPWYGLEGNNLTFERLPQEGDIYIQRQLEGFGGSFNKKILARSTINGEVVFIEEKIGNGRIIAMDLLTPCEPYWKFESIQGWKERGGFNKYVFLGNICNRSVRKGKYFDKKKTLIEFLKDVEELANKYPFIKLKRETPVVFSLTIGDDLGKPIYVFRGDTHQAIEWAGAYHCLAFCEYICKNIEKMSFSLGD